MLSSREILIAICLHLGFSAAAGDTCSKPKYSAYLPILSGYAPAASWCSSEHPLPTVTSTSTLRKAGAAKTVTDTTVTVHSTQTRTTTTTYLIHTSETVTAQSMMSKRALPTTLEKRAPNPTKLALSSLKQASPAVAQTVCSCLETPVTKIVTKTVAEPKTVHTTATSVIQDNETITKIVGSTTVETITVPKPTPDPDPTCQTKECYNGFTITRGCQEKKYYPMNLPEPFGHSNVHNCINNCKAADGCVYAAYAEPWCYYSNNIFSGDMFYVGPDSNGATLGCSP